MTKLARAGGVVALLFLCFVIWYVIAADYSDKVASGSYHLSQNDETSTLILKSDHSFQQELSKHGRVERATGTWRRIGEGGIAFSKEFLTVSGQEPGADGTAYGEIHKRFGFLVSITLAQYHVLWYRRVDPSPSNSVPGTYTGDEEGIAATLVLDPNHTFEQSVSKLGVTKHAKGTWNLTENGDIVFSKDFLKTSGEALRNDETASAWNPKGSILQIQIAVNSKSGVPAFRKSEFLW
jgi:hypothetical protein